MTLSWEIFATAAKIMCAAEGAGNTLRNDIIKHGLPIFCRSDRSTDPCLHVRKLPSGLPSLAANLHLLRQDVSLSLELPYFIELAGQQVPGLHLSPFPSTGATDVVFSVCL